MGSCEAETRLEEKEIQQRLDKFVSHCEQAFTQGEVTGILFHGSMETLEHSSKSDCDLAIIFKGQNRLYLEKLKEVIADSEDTTMFCSIKPLFLTEIPKNADYYSQNTNGAFFAWHMRTAKVIYGENPFDQMFGPNPHQLALSLWQKIQQYTGETRKMFIQPSISAETRSKIVKNIFKSIKDLMMIKGLYCKKRTEQLNGLIDKFPEIITEDQRSFLESFTKSDLKNDAFLDETGLKLSQLLIIQEAIYAEFLKVVKDALRVEFLKKED